MWNEIVINLSSYSSATLTLVDAAGYPFSIRCTPKPDPSQKRLTIEPLEGLPIWQGPASLMCHSHDEFLWELKSFLVRGNLEIEGAVWGFYPSKYVKSGASSSRPIDQIKGLMNARATAKKYLEKRGIPRPKIPWNDLKLLRAEANRD